MTSGVSKEAMLEKRPHIINDFEKVGLRKTLLKTFFAKDHIGYGQRHLMDTMLYEYDWRLMRVNPKDIIEKCLHPKLKKWLEEEEEMYWLEQDLDGPQKFPFRNEPIIIGTKRVGSATYKAMMCAFGDTRYMIWDGFHRTASAIRDKRPAVWAIIIDLDGQGIREV